MKRVAVLLVAFALLVIPAIALGNHGNPGEHVANAITILDGINAKPSVEQQIAAARAELVQAQNDLAPPPTTPPPTTPPPTSPPPPGECVGVQVPAGADLRAVIPNSVAETYCLAAGTYELGANTLGFDSGDIIVGQPVTFGSKGEVFVQTFIHGTGTAVIKAGTGDVTLSVENVDICCSPNTTGSNASGNGISGSYEILRNLTVRNSRIHGNGSTGITGVGEGLVVENSEIDHNGDTSDGIDAGIKTVHYAEIRSTFFHDNWNGMWFDCDVPGGIVENSRFEANRRSGIYVEISSGDSGSPRPLPAGKSYGFVIRGNTVDGNNTGNNGWHAGILVISSKNVLIDQNTAINNLHADIRVDNDGRQNNGHNGCSSGFVVNNVTVSNNSYGPLPLLGESLAGTTWTNNTKIL